MKYIAIEREYGSGGSIIAKRLSEKCGIPCYGTEILEEAARVLGNAPEDIRQNEEKATGSLLYSIFMMSQMAKVSDDMLTKEGRIFAEEQKIIQDFARQGRAIFLGHCAVAALKDFDGVAEVYIHADRESKYARIQQDYGIPAGDAEAAERKNNRRRSNYYYTNTQRKWEDLRHYDVVLDTSRISLDLCVELLAGLL